MPPKSNQATRRANAKAAAKGAGKGHVPSAPGENEEGHLRWLAAQDLSLQRRVSEMAMRFAAAKETTPDAELPLACKYASEDPSRFNKIMDVIHAPAGSDLDQLRWLACQAEPLQEKIRAIANEMAAALGVATNDGFLIAVSRRARADPEAFMLGRTRLNESSHSNNANDAVPRAGLAPFSGAAHRLSGTPQQQPEGAAGRVAPDAKGMDGDAAPQPERLTEADREVRRANEEARERKRLTKKAAIQPSLISTTAAADDATDLGAPAVNPPSKNARRRQEKKAKQRRAGQERVEKQRQRDDDETRRILKQVEPLREAAGTLVKEDLETLESVQALEAVLEKEQKGGAAKPGRKLLGKMRYEVLAFVEAYEGTAPEAANFARNLLDGLGQRSPEEGYNRGAAEELYGDFADSFAAHTWHAPHLRQTDYATVLRAAALA